MHHNSKRKIFQQKYRSLPYFISATLFGLVLFGLMFVINPFQAGVGIFGNVARSLLEKLRLNEFWWCPEGAIVSQRCTGQRSPLLVSR